MTRNRNTRVPGQGSLGGMLGRIHRARSPLIRPQDDRLFSLLSEDEDSESDESGTEPGDEFRRMRQGVGQIELSDDGDDGSRAAGQPVDLTEDDDEDEDGTREEAHFQRDVSTASAGVIGAGIPWNNEHLDFATTVFGVRVRPNDTVELYCAGDANLPDYTSFLRIIFITRDPSGTVFVHGILLKRHHDVDKKFSHSKDYQGILHSLLPCKKNELCAMMKVQHNSDLLSLESTLETRRIDQVGLVRNVTFTNKSREDLSGRTRGETYTKPQWKEAEENGDLFCRHKFIEEVDTKKKKVVAFQIRQLQQHESDPGAGIAVERKFEVFRAHTFSPANTPGPAVNKRKRGPEVITIEDSDDDLDLNAFEQKFKSFDKKKKTAKKSKTVRSATETVVFQDDNGDEERLTYKVVEELTTTRSGRKEKKKHIYADMCAGAGGTSAGVKMAGFRLQYLLDYEPDACKSLRLNFGEAEVYQMDIGIFAASAATLNDIVDVMHISFPCQGHSMLNHQTNEDKDATNISIAYSTFGLILRKCKPRIVTLEQVAGIMYRSGGQHLRAQIFELVEAGYSVRWSLLNFAEYGNAQARPRVIVIAACPGQVLPPFPEVTHGNGPGLKPFVTIADVLAQVPRHPRGIMSHSVPRSLPPYSADQVLRGCITSGGTGAKNRRGYHPSGKRDFNLQELAQLQGFSAGHRFYGNVTSVRKQIGNAVPPVFSAKLYKSIVPALEETDRKMEAWAEVIEL